MRAIILLLSVYFCINSCFLYIHNLAKKDVDNWKTSIFNPLAIFLGLKCFILLLGGVLATFIVPAPILFIISIVSFILGIPFLLLGNIYLIIGILFMGVSAGLFKFICLVIILDHKEPSDIQMKMIAYDCLETLCDAAIFTYLPSKYHIYIFGCVASISVLLLVVGKVMKMYSIDSKTVNIFEIISFLRRKDNLFETYDKKIKSVIISISKSTIIFILILPFGLCGSQERAAFDHQAHRLKQPNITFFEQHSHFIPHAISLITVFIFLVIFMSLKYRHYPWFNNIYANVRYQIIFGYFLMIISTILCAVLETNRYSMNKSNKFNNQFIEHKFYNVTKLSVFYMAPQIILLTLSEVIVIPLYIKFLYIQSIGSVKYLSLAYLMSGIGFGGIPEFASFGIGKLVVNKGYQRFDYAMYGISCGAFITGLISIYMMKKFDRYFHPNAHVKRIASTIVESSGKMSDY